MALQQTRIATQQAGLAGRIDHRSEAEQGIKRLPRLPLEPPGQALEARGIETARGAAARAGSVPAPSRGDAFLPQPFLGQVVLGLAAHPERGVTPPQAFQG